MYTTMQNDRDNNNDKNSDNSAIRATSDEVYERAI